MNKADLDPEVLLTMARVDRILAKLKELKTEKFRLRDLDEHLIDSP